jgi:hypothetical protein
MSDMKQTPIFDTLTEAIDRCCDVQGQKPKRVVVGKGCAEALLKEYRIRVCDPTAPLPPMICDLPLEVKSWAQSTSWFVCGATTTPL